MLSPCGSKIVHNKLLLLTLTLLHICPRCQQLCQVFCNICSFDLIKSGKKETGKQVKFKSLGLAMGKGKHVHYHRDNIDSFLSNGEKKGK